MPVAASSRAKSNSLQQAATALPAYWQAAKLVASGQVSSRNRRRNAIASASPPPGSRCVVQPLLRRPLVGTRPRLSRPHPRRHRTRGADRGRRPPAEDGGRPAGKPNARRPGLGRHRGLRRARQLHRAAGQPRLRRGAGDRRGHPRHRRNGGGGSGRRGEHRGRRSAPVVRARRTPGAAVSPPRGRARRLGGRACDRPSAPGGPGRADRRGGRGAGRCPAGHGGCGCRHLGPLLPCAGGRDHRLAADAGPSPAPGGRPLYIDPPRAALPRGGLRPPPREAAEAP
jgi:hypothetical protein